MTKQELKDEINKFYEYDSTYLLPNARLYGVTSELRALTERSNFILSMLEQLIDKLPDES